MRIHPATQRMNRGFTAIELLVTIAIVAILAAIAAPNFQPMFERYRLQRAIGEWENAIFFARTEALKRGGNVYIRKTPSGDGCTAGTTDDWSCGWTVVYSPTGSSTPVSTDVSLQTFSRPSNTYVMLDPSGVSLLFNSSGRQRLNLIKTTFTPDKNNSVHAMAIVCSSAAGRLITLKGEIDCPGS